MVEKVFGISPDELKLRLKLPTLEKEEVTGVESDDIPVGVNLAFLVDSQSMDGMGYTVQLPC